MREVSPIEIEFSRGATKLYIFFGGIASGIAMPPFEFYHSSRIVSEHKIFVRDTNQCWYHNGLPGISTDLDSTARYLAAEIEKINPDKTFFVGNSMGGFAAILFSILLKRGQVISFSPQTFISPWLRLLHKDKRWTKQIRNTYKQSLFKAKIWNLRALLIKEGWTPDISIFVSQDDKLDYLHAMHLLNIPGVKVHSFANGGHGVVKLLREQGLLPAIMSGEYV